MAVFGITGICRVDSHDAAKAESWAGSRGSCITAWVHPAGLLSTRRSSVIEVEHAAEYSMNKLAPLGAREPAPTTPYRRESAEIRAEFLDLLAEAQSDLAAAAHDNGWDLDNRTICLRLSREQLRLAKQIKVVWKSMRRRCAFS